MSLCRRLQRISASSESGFIIKGAPINEHRPRPPSADRSHVKPTGAPGARRTVHRQRHTNTVVWLLYRWEEKAPNAAVCADAAPKGNACSDRPHLSTEQQPNGPRRRTRVCASKRSQKHIDQNINPSNHLILILCYYIIFFFSVVCYYFYSVKLEKIKNKKILKFSIFTPTATAFPQIKNWTRLRPESVIKSRNNDDFHK